MEALKTKFMKTKTHSFLLSAAEVHESVASATAYAAGELRPVLLVWGALRNGVELVHPKALC